MDSFALISYISVVLVKVLTLAPYHKPGTIITASTNTNASLMPVSMAVWKLMFQIQIPF